MDSIGNEIVKSDIDLLTEEENKKMKGQFFTITNPFNIDIFHKWVKMIPEEDKATIIEPFAGANNIVKMVEDLDIKALNGATWKCYDIEPSEANAVPGLHIEQRDTISNFPQVGKVAITNPPYLAKNSATRSGIPFQDCEFDDLYKHAVDVMLDNLDYVAAIIPESFINSNLFHERLFAFVSLTCKMFNDTECPVCLALFIPYGKKVECNLRQDDFFVYRQNKKLGKYKSLEKKKPTSNIENRWTFNDRNGNIGIRCIDGLTKASIEFVKGETIEAEKIKVSSRSLTRVSGLPEGINVDRFIAKCNEILEQYREDTEDIFLTSFKGLRKDNMYRRRLDFANAKSIMNAALGKINGGED